MFHPTDRKKDLFTSHNIWPTPMSRECFMINRTARAGRTRGFAKDASFQRLSSVLRHHNLRWSWPHVLTTFGRLKSPRKHQQVGPRTTTGTTRKLCKMPLWFSWLRRRIQMRKVSSWEMCHIMATMYKNRIKFLTDGERNSSSTRLT